MAKPVKTAAALFGLGVGLVVGPALGPVAIWLGVAVAALGIGLSLIGTAESDLVGDGLVDRDEPAGDRSAAGTAGVAERQRRNANRTHVRPPGTPGGADPQTRRGAGRRSPQRRAARRREDGERRPPGGRGDPAPGARTGSGERRIAAVPALCSAHPRSDRSLARGSDVPCQRGSPTAVRRQDRSMTTSTRIVGRSVHGLTYAVLGWAVAYGGVRLAWTVGDAPEFGRLGLDLLGFTGWWSVALCARRAAGGRPGPGGDLAAGARGARLDGRRSAGRGSRDPVAGAGGLPALHRRPVLRPAGVRQPLVYVTGAALLALSAARYRRRTRGDPQPAAGRSDRVRRRSVPARWARWAAWAAVGGHVDRSRPGSSWGSTESTERSPAQVGDRPGAGGSAVAAGAGAPLG